MDTDTVDISYLQDQIEHCSKVYCNRVFPHAAGEKTTLTSMIK